jgi:hypothetical protein
VTRRERAIPAALALAAFALALLQRPGWASSDTKIDLHVSPGRFLGDVASVWTQSGSLGHVQGGQYGGYLFPMGPFYALGHALGLAPWLVHRLWLGALLALAAWGTVRLLDDLAGRPRGAAHVVGGAMVVLNPYVVVFTARTSITLLAYAALPWLLLAVYRGVRRPRGWWWPAVFALAVTASGGGVNAAVTAWVLVGPALLLGYEVLGGVPRRAARDFALRTIVLTFVASLWWIGPILAQARYGIDFLKFTEQQGTIWGTTSLSETWRLMGYWVSYIGVGFHGATRSYFSDAGTLLYTPLVVSAGLLVPALALGGFAWTRRARYGPFFLALALVGAIVMAAGFPEGTPLREGLNFTYNRVEATHFLRTTYKAGPLVALGLAGLGGLGAAALWTRVRRPPARAALAAGAALLLAVAAWPLASGDALDEQLLWKRVPSAWTQTARDLDRDLPAQTRAVVAPGELFAYYRWGGTIDPILPALTERPVAVRNIVPFADLRAIDAHWTVDALAGQDRLVPGQLTPLLRWLGTGALVANADGDISRSGQPPPADAARVLAAQGFGRPDRAYGPVRRLLPGAGELAAPADLPDVRRYDLAGARRIVRVAPLARPTVVDGSADAVAGLAAFGALPPSVLYAADRDPGELRAAVRAGADVVISDSNRRRVFVPSRLEQNLGWTLGPDEDPSEDAAMLNPFADRGSDAQTVALYGGARVRAPFSPGGEQYPEHRPYAAFDGDPDTAWLADRYLERPRRWVEIELARPRDIPYVDVLPENDRYGTVRGLDVGGRHFDVRPGWNRLRLGLRRVDRLRVLIADVDYPPNLFAGGAGGILEVRIPGLRVRERLRPPVVAERALARGDLRHSSLSYLFQRTTGDAPFRRGRFTGPAQALLPADRGDAETGLSRTFRPPAARAFRADAWATVSPRAPDDALDALAGARGPGRFTSSSRFEGRPAWRASSAFDADPATAWIGQWVERAPAWIGWETPRDATVSSLRLKRPREVVRFPTRVRLTAGAVRTGPLAVAPDGTVALPGPLRARSFRLAVLAAEFPPGATPQERTRRTVGIAAISAPGIPRPEIPRTGPIRGTCADLTARLDRQRLSMRVGGTVEDLDLGIPLRARACGAAAELPAEPVTLTVPDGTFRPYWLRLSSPAPRPLPRAAAPGTVTDLGDAGRGRHDGVEVRLRAPALLVLGESFNRGWRAYCDGRSLGTPRPADGYANGWRAPADCRDVRFAFAAQLPVNVGYAISALACLLLLAFLLLRRPGPATVQETDSPHSAADSPLSADDSPHPMPLPRALALALPVAAAIGFVFALRSGAVAFPLVALILWRGIGARPLALAAGALLALEPAIYLVFLPSDRGGGYNFNYPLDLVGAHWVAVAALVLLAFSLWRRLNPSLKRSRGRSTT